MHKKSIVNHAISKSVRCVQNATMGAASVMSCGVVSQVCLAYRNGEGKVVVVLSQRPKLEMEATFRRIIPEEQRFGSKFVFREGSAIIPDNLRMVAASRAAATIIVSDSSR